MCSEILTVSDRYSSRERQTAIRSFLRTFGEKPATDIQFSRIPCTNGKVVWLGDCCIPSRLFETLALGHGIHEMMHVQHTDFSQAVGQDRLTLHLLNCLEDVRLDRLGGQQNPAYRIWRETLAVCRQQQGRLRVKQQALQAESLRQNAASETMEPQAAIEVLVTWLHCELTARDGYRWALLNLSQARDLVRVLPERCKRALLKESERVFEAKSTGDCLKIVKKLCAILNDEINYQNLSASKRRQLEAQMGSLFNESTDNSQTLSVPGFLGKILSESKIKSAPRSNNISEHALSNNFSLSGNSINDAIPDLHYRVGTWPVMTKVVQKNSLRNEFIDCFKRAQNRLPRDVRAFARLLYTRDEESGRRFSRQGVDFRDDWLDTLADRDTQLFETSDAGRSIDAEICILLDRSGSMGVVTMTMAKVAVYALLCALDPIRGVSSRVALFPGLSDKHVAIAKDRHEPLSLFEKKVAAIDAFGSTPIQESMHWALDTFGKSRARDKLLVVITDGRFHAERSREMQIKLSAHGIEFALMSIDIDNKGAADNHVLVQTPEQIHQGFLKLFSQTTFVKALRS